MSRPNISKALAVLVIVSFAASLCMIPLQVFASPSGSQSSYDVSGANVAAVPVSGHRIVGYFVQWGIYRRNYLVKNVDTGGSAARMTHINYAFADANSSYRCASADPFADYNKAFDASESVDGVGDLSSQKLRGNFNQLRELKQKYPHLKVLISVGGWSLSSNFSQAAMPANRSAFVASCIDMYLKGNFDPANGIVGYSGIFDGIDIDWEYPGACGLTCDFSPDDKANFTALMAEFRTQMNALSQQTGQTYLLTAATSADEDTSSHIDLPAVVPYMDWINIMTYDFHGSWEATTNMHSPLYGDPADPTYASHYWSDNAVSVYLARGVPASKLTMGVPFYARGWGGVSPGPNGDGLYQTAGGRPPRGKYENGIDDYKEMIAREATFTKYFHPLAQSVYIYDGRTFWTYDDPASMTNKMNYIKSKGLSGVMFWELSGDTASIALLSALYNGLNGAPSSTNTPAPPTNTPIPPTATPTLTPGGPTTTPAPTNTPIPTNTVGPTPTAGGGSTGFRSPAAHAPGTGGDGNGFELSPSNAFGNDGSLAVDVDSGTAGTLVCNAPARDNHDFFNYGFALPTGSTVAGIEVQLQALVDLVKNSAALCVQLSADGGATWTAAKTTPALTTTETTYLLGGATDTWGRSWTAADLSNANFRVRITTIATANVRDFSVDWIAVKVYTP
jgi:chitinase